jgi:uncharacterized protein (TIGR03437 family)
MDVTEPGIFTNNPVGGLGYAAALHPDFSLVSPSSPAKIGETVAIYLTGLGDVSPTVTDGSPGPATSFSSTVNPVAVSIDGMPANVTYSGLAPGLAGLYQINVTVPTGVSNGDIYVAVSGPDSFSAEALLTVGTASSANPQRRPAAGVLKTAGTTIDRTARLRARRTSSAPHTTNRSSASRDAH